VLLDIGRAARIGVIKLIDHRHERKLHVRSGSGPGREKLEELGRRVLAGVSQDRQKGGAGRGKICEIPNYLAVKALRIHQIPWKNCTPFIAADDSIVTLRIIWHRTSLDIWRSLPHECSSNALSMTEQTKLLSELEKSFEQNVFVMMRYRSTDRFKDIEATIRQALSKYGLIARLAKDAALSDDLWENIQHYMRYCRFGIAVFEEIDEREFNPNISLELGYMYALRRRCLLLKDRRMPRLPTDTCGKIYRDFDTYRLSDSLAQEISEWCKRDLRLSERSAADPAQPQGTLIFDSDTEDPGFRDWGVHDSTRQFEQHIRLVSTQRDDDAPGASSAIQISASASESVGVNKKLGTLFGRARFAYKALESKAKVINVYFSMIPMQSEQSGNSLLEVGGTRQADPDNAYSPYRKRYYIPLGHIGDDAWHEAEIEFDFRDIPTAAYSIFAARINEGCPKPAAGKLLIRSIKVVSYDRRTGIQPEYFT
jgi:hypothetical protein